MTPKFEFSTPLSGLARPREGRCFQASSYDRGGGNDDYIGIDPGQTAVLADIRGPGAVNRIWLTVASPDPDKLRNLALRMYWDDEPEPSVETPLADFFLNPFLSRRSIPALPMGYTSGGYYSYLPMPFSNRARIEVENQSRFPAYSFYYHVTYTLQDEPDEGALRFHAQWRRQTAEAGRNLVFLEALGRGHLAGLSVGIRGRDPLSLWFLEGDELIFVDGDAHPAVHGTGTEDYFNGGWYFNTGPFTAPYHGVVTKDFLTARIAAFRFHVEDPIPFGEAISVQFEHGGTNDAEGCVYDSVAYWYQAEPHARFPAMPDAGERMQVFSGLERGLRQGAGFLADSAFKILNWHKGLSPRKINRNDRPLECDA